MTAAAEMVSTRFPVMISSGQTALVVKGTLSLIMTIFVVTCVTTYTDGSTTPTGCWCCAAMACRCA